MNSSEAHKVGVSTPSRGYRIDNHTAVMEEPEAQRGFESAFDSPTFTLDMSIRVDQPVGSMSISPCGRDVVLASYVHRCSILSYHC